MTGLAMGRGQRWTRRDDAADRLPPYARPRRQRFSFGVIAALLTGFGAMGMTGFVTVAAIVEREAAADQFPTVGDEFVTGSDGSVDENRPVGDDGTDPLTANPLYDTGELEPSECPVPELDAGDPQSMEEFLNTQTDCLDETWEHQFERGELGFEYPVRVFWSTAGQSPCGQYPTEDTAAFYCRQNKGLYLGVTDVALKSNGLDVPEAYSRLLAHEYGHHVQGEAGIHDALGVAQATEPTPEGDDALSRRNELQADCLGAAFLGSIQDSYPIADEERANILEDAAARADKEDEDDRRTHGAPEQAVLWTEHGLDRRDPAACNTWDARQDLVE